MTTPAKPKVFISYSWLTEQREDGRTARVPDPRAFELAERLRGAGFDSRIDAYFKNNLHGFAPPEFVPGDQRDPWIVFAESQIRDADCVLLLCTPDYVQSDSSAGACPGPWCDWHRLDDATRYSKQVPFLWYDWHFIKSALDLNRAPREKFIPVGFGPYNRNLIPDFVRGAEYCDLEVEFESLTRRIRAVYRKQNPRQGIFISYAHDDERLWLDSLLRHIAPLRGHGVEVWTDRDIVPGDLWNEDIQNSLERAQVAILMVTAAFLASPYIVSNELPRLLQAANSEGLIVFWIPVKPSSYSLTEIKHFQAAHPPSQPLSGIEGVKLDEAFVAITAKLADVLHIR
jgi:hypothetical protein